MGTARPSVTKRQREQVRRERQARKAEKRAERKNNPQASDIDQDVIQETPELDLEQEQSETPAD